MELKQSGKGDESASVRSFSAKETPVMGPRTVTKKPVVSKSKSRSRATPSGSTRTRPKPKPRAKPKRVLYTHGAYICCSECDACPIRGARYVSMLRENYNLCEECEMKLMEPGKLEDPMIKIYKPRSNWHIKHFIEIRNLVALPDLNEERNSLMVDRNEQREESASQVSQSNGVASTSTPKSESK